MLDLVMLIISMLLVGVAIYYKWQVADIQVELDAALEESMRRQRLLENEMVKSGNLRAANLELGEKVKALMAQKSIGIGVRVPMGLGRTIYFN